MTYVNKSDIIIVGLGLCKRACLSSSLCFGILYTIDNIYCTISTHNYHVPAAGAAAHSPHRGWYTSSSQASRVPRAASWSGHRTSCSTSCQVVRGAVRGHWYTTYRKISLDIIVVLLYIVSR